MSSDLTFVIGSQGLPVGTYRVQFAGAEPFLDNVERYGEGVLLKWEVLDGEHQGETATRIVSRRTGKTANLTKFIVALKGGPVSPGEEVSLSTFVGAEGTVIVEETESGATRVATFLRDK